jgi:2-polyprenyl-3-methyl-5-hydroxy-6-metoxy-1,4-benzoquinol methylase
MSLSQIADHTATDKDTVHSYLPLYTEHLTHMKDTATRVLEVGIHKGGSIKMWSDFFTNAKVYGIDQSTEHLQTDLSNPNIKCIITNAYDAEFVKSLEYGTFDMVLDDGPHSKESMIFFAREYSKLLKPGGVMIIEDIQSSDWFADILMSLPKNMLANSTIHDLRSIKGRYDDLVIIAYNK